MATIQNTALVADLEILSDALIQAVKAALKTHNVKDIFGPGELTSAEVESAQLDI